VDLLERQSAKASLDAALSAAPRGSGQVVLVAGEAGIGKTSLVRAFVAAARGRSPSSTTHRRSHRPSSRPRRLYMNAEPVAARAAAAQALELAESPDPDTVVAALATLDGLGAGPAATVVRRRLRELGVQRIPRGPVPPTRENPGGLTDRQVGVLTPLAEGRSNPEIAERLVLSERTVDHHVSAILAKLGVTSRRKAARFVR
jgi:DNA-binding NarL/FixJ family response regulator